MLEWLKTILGEKYTPEIDAKVTEEIGKGYAAKAEVSAVQSELAAAKASLKERDGQLEALKKETGDTAALTQKITQLQEENLQKDKDHAAQLRQLRLDNAVSRALAEARAINPATVTPLLAGFLEKAQIGEDGSVAGLAEEIGKLQKGENTAFLFSQGGTAPKLSGATPAGGGGGTPENPKQAQYAAQLAEAYKNNDTLTAIHVKREAAGQGIFMN